jgi:hypothetical protein
MQSGHITFEGFVTQDLETKVMFVSKIYFTHHIADVTSAKNRYRNSILNWDYMGPVIDTHGIRTTPKKTDAYLLEDMLLVTV